MVAPILEGCMAYFLVFGKLMEIMQLLSTLSVLASAIEIRFHNRRECGDGIELVGVRFAMLGGSAGRIRQQG